MKTGAAGQIIGRGRLAVLLCALAPCALAPAGAQQNKPVREVYTCIDGSGRRITSDRPIAACIDREQRILDHTGAERRRIGPTLTEHERAALEVQRRKEAEQRARLAEERRRERVLLARYPDEASHREERLNAVAQVDEVIAVAHKRIADLRAERKRIDVELEFYRRDPNKAPPKLQRQIAENEEAIAEQQRFIAAQDQEKRRVHQRFDAELAQLRKLWEANRVPPTVPDAPSPPVADSAAPAGGAKP